MITIIMSIILLSFLYLACEYVLRRKKIAMIIKDNNNDDDEDDDDDDDNDDDSGDDDRGNDNYNSRDTTTAINNNNGDDVIERLVVRRNDRVTRTTILDPNWCKGLVLRIPSSKVKSNDDDDDEEICNELGGRFCSGMEMKRVNIPDTFKTEIYSSSGFRLYPGQSYCLYKQPPLLNTTSTSMCDDVWGFWKYSPIYERWLCTSKVPGIYNAKTNRFDACERDDPNGLLLFDGQIVDDFKRLNLVPEDFYSEEFQKRFECDCPSFGYLSKPELSRTFCFRDPCTLSLPIHAFAPGYDEETGNCDCGKHYVNMYNSEAYPCTACPTSFPDYDPDTHTLSVFIKCYNDDDNEFGLFPCHSQEDKIRGCMKARVNVKPIQKHQNVSSFEERIFF